MSAQPAPDERAEFEAALFDLFEFAPDRPSFERYPDGDYVSGQTHKFWRIWQARAALAALAAPVAAAQPDSPKAVSGTSQPVESLRLVCAYISDVLASDATSGEKHIARRAMHLLPLEAAFSAAQPESAPVAVPQGWPDLARRCLEAMEDAVRYGETGKGRPPQQTCLFEIQDLRAMLAAAPSAPVAAAPAPQPLTDEQIAAIVREASAGSAMRRDGSTSQRIARAIEAAHGIKAG